VSSTYTRPNLYQLAFSYRDFESEAAFLRKVAARHGVDVECFLELACGPGDHSLAMARAGLQVAALDRSEEMIAYLAERSASAGLEIEAVVGDMREARPDFERRFDLAATLIGSVDHLATNADFCKHLRAVARHLKPGGIYVVDMVHPRTVFGVESTTETSWRMERDGLAVEVQWGEASDVFDPVAEIVHTSVTLQANAHGEGLPTIREVFPMRRYSYQTVQALLEASQSGFKCLGSYGAFDLDVPLGDSKAWRMILVLGLSG
jgi:SAM-dependent methyltransferase